MTMMDEFAKLRGAKADWIVVMRGECQINMKSMDGIYDEYDFSEMDDGEEMDPYYVEKKKELENVYTTLQKFLISTD